MRFLNKEERLIKKIEIRDKIIKEYMEKLEKANAENEELQRQLEFERNKPHVAFERTKEMMKSFAVKQKELEVLVEELREAKEKYCCEIEEIKELKEKYQAIM